MRKIITFTATTLLMASAFGAGEVYRWRGADGSWHYSDQYRPGAELVASTPAARLASEPDSPPSVPTQSQPASEPAETTGEIPVSPEVAAEVRSAVATVRAEQCKKAEESYQKALQARRITKTDAQGNKVFMTEAEMDAARLQARANRDVACGSTSP